MRAYIGSSVLTSQGLRCVDASASIAIAEDVNDRRADYGNGVADDVEPDEMNDQRREQTPTGVH
jgi:hypothetical protein